MKPGTKGGKLGTIGRQAYQGLTAGFGDELIDYTTAPIVAAITGRPLAEIVDDARSGSNEDLSRDDQNAYKTALASNLAGGIIPGIASGTRAVAQMGMGALSGAGSANGGLEDRLKGAGVGGALGLAGQGVAKGLNRVTKGASDLISPEVRKTAAKLKSMGVPVRLSQLMDSKFLSMVDNAISKVPFSGANKSQEAQRKAFTKALTNTFGEDADTITDDVLGSAKTRLSGEYDKILGNTDIPIDRPAFAQQLSQIVDDLSLENDEAGAEFIRKQADNILNTIDNNGGKLTGKAYQKLRQTLKGAKGNNFSIGQIQKFVDDTVRNSVPENIGSQLSKTDGQYRNMKIAEKLYGQLQNSSGQIKPETLYNAAKSNIGDLAYGGGGDLGELSRAGRLLKPTIPDSGTASQLMGSGALGAAGVGAFLDPSIAVGAMGTIGAARGLNKAMTSDYLQSGMRNGIQAGAQKLENSAVIPSMLRAGQQQSNAQETYSPENDPQLQGMVGGYDPEQDPELQNLLQGYDPENDPELQQLIQGTSTETIQNEAAPLNAPMRTTGLQDRIKQAESGGNPNARNPNSSASGPYQFTDSTWAGMVKNYPETGITVADKGNATAQEIMAELLTQENTNAYKSKGIEPNEADLYAAHFLGGPAAVKAKLNPTAYGAEQFPQAAKSNPTIFYDGRKPRTNAEINRLLGQKIGAL